MNVKQNKINVVDSVMGSGKTSAIIDMINADPDGNYIFVTPYLDEAERIAKATKWRFKQPKIYPHGSKLESWHDLMAGGECIVTTHSLFRMSTPETVRLIEQGGYVLILDEALDVLEEYNNKTAAKEGKSVTKGDLQFLQQQKLISISPVDCSVKWERSEVEDMHYSEIARLSKAGTLRCVDNFLFWEFPIDIFKAFEQVYVLTYLFRGSILSYYFELYGLEYELVSAHHNDNGRFVLCEYSDSQEQRKALIPLINIYQGKYNSIGNNKLALSQSGLLRMLEKKKDKGMNNGNNLKTLKKYMRNMKNYFRVEDNSKVMWTTTKQNDFYRKIEEIPGFKKTGFNSDTKTLDTDYIEWIGDNPSKEETEDKRVFQFVPSNARATNDYAERDTLMYILNKFMHPEVKKYFVKRGCSVNENMYALSEMLQWIWRSAIRNGQPINLYVPSSRMRKLLFEWLGREDFVCNKELQKRKK